MPTYDYECDKCDHRFEPSQGLRAALQRKCPECGALKLQRLIGTGAGILFKGSGFYETDYRSDAYRKDASKDTGSDKGCTGNPESCDRKSCPSE